MLSAGQVGSVTWSPLRPNEIYFDSRQAKRTLCRFGLAIAVAGAIISGRRLPPAGRTRHTSGRPPRSSTQSPGSFNSRDSYLHLPGENARRSGVCETFKAASPEAAIRSRSGSCQSGSAFPQTRSGMYPAPSTAGPESLIPYGISGISSTLFNR